MSVQCPNCGSTDLKDGAAVNGGEITFDYGCRECRAVFDRPVCEECGIDISENTYETEYGHRWVEHKASCPVRVGQ